VNVQQISWGMPSVLPTPTSWSNIVNTNIPIYFGSGGFLCATNSIACTPSGTSYRAIVTTRCITDATSNNRGIYLQQSGNSCGVFGFWATINYFTS
jgi:hypothetical protein